MKILFINPNIDTGGYKPLAISVLTAIAKKEGHEISVFDTSFVNVSKYSSNEEHTETQVAGEEVLNFVPVDLAGHNIVEEDIDLEKSFVKKLQEFSPDMIALTIFSNEYGLGVTLLQIAKKYNSNIITLTGGVHCIADPQGVIKNDCVDFVCRGEGEDLFKKLLKKINQNEKNYTDIPGLWWKEAGEVKNNSIGHYTNMEDLPFMNYDDFDDRLFIRAMNGKVYRSADVSLTRGCFEKCSYCLFDKMYEISEGGRNIRKPSVKRSIEELQYLIKRHNLNFIRFQDSTFLSVSDKFLKEYAKEYIDKIGLPFVIDSTPQNVTYDKIKCLKEMNCLSISVGLETGNEKMRLTQLNKKATNEKIIHAFHTINSFNIRTVSFILLGFPFETRENIFETIDLIRKCEVAAPNVGFVYPFKGTKLRDNSIKSGAFDPSIEVMGVPQYSRDRPVIKNKNITGDEYAGLYRTFMFYCKFPRSYFPDIAIAEQLTDEGNLMYQRLKKEYATNKLYNTTLDTRLNARSSNQHASL